MKTFLNSSTYDHKIHSNGEFNDQPSMTVPDQSMTVDEIIDMYARGLSIDQLIKPSYGLDNPSWDDLDPTQDPAFDMLEANQLLKEVQEKIALAKQNVVSSETTDNGVTAP